MDRRIVHTPGYPVSRPLDPSGTLVFDALWSNGVRQCVALPPGPRHVVVTFDGAAEEAAHTLQGQLGIQLCHADLLAHVEGVLHYYRPTCYQAPGYWTVTRIGDDECEVRLHAKPTLQPLTAPEGWALTQSESYLQIRFTAALSTEPLLELPLTPGLTYSIDWDAWAEDLVPTEAVLEARLGNMLGGQVYVYRHGDVFEWRPDDDFGGCVTVRHPDLPKLVEELQPPGRRAALAWSAHGWLRLGATSVQFTGPTR